MCGGLNESELANYGQHAGSGVWGGHEGRRYRAQHKNCGPRPGFELPHKARLVGAGCYAGWWEWSCPLHPVVKQGVCHWGRVGRAAGRRAEAHGCVRAGAQVGGSLDNASGDEDEWLGTDTP
jgi:hypothetical protein